MISKNSCRYFLLSGAQILSEPSLYESKLIPVLLTVSIYTEIGSSSGGSPQLLVILMIILPKLSSAYLEPQHAWPHPVIAPGESTGHVLRRRCQGQSSSSDAARNSWAASHAILTYRGLDNNELSLFRKHTVNRYTDRQRDRRMDACTDECTYGWTDRWMYVRKDRQMDVCMDGQTEGCM